MALTFEIQLEEWFQRSPSSRPSPPGRRRIVCRLTKCRESELAGRPLSNQKIRQLFPLLGERENVTHYSNGARLSEPQQPQRDGIFVWLVWDSLLLANLRSGIAPGQNSYHQSRGRLCDAVGFPNLSHRFFYARVTSGDRRINSQHWTQDGKLRSQRERYTLIYCLLDVMAEGFNARFVPTASRNQQTFQINFHSHSSRQNCLCIWPG